MTEVELDTGVFSGVWRRSMWQESAADWPVNEDSELASRYLERGGRIRASARWARAMCRAAAWPASTGATGYSRAQTARRHPRSLRRSHMRRPPALALTALPLVAIPRACGSCRRRAGGIRQWRARGVGAGRAGLGRHGGAALLPAVFVAMHAWPGRGLRLPAAGAGSGIPTAAAARPGRRPTAAPHRVSCAMASIVENLSAAPSATPRGHGPTRVSCAATAPPARSRSTSPPPSEPALQIGSAPARIEGWLPTIGEIHLDLEARLPFEDDTLAYVFGASTSSARCPRVAARG